MANISHMMAEKELKPPTGIIMIHLYTVTKNLLLYVAAAAIFTAGCISDSPVIDLANDDEQKRQTFNQILNNPELQNEFFMELRNNKEAMNRMMQIREFTDELFNKDNMNYMWEHNPGMDTAIIDNVTTRMHTDTVFMNKFHSRMERGTPTGTPR